MKLRDVLPREFFLKHIVHSTAIFSVQPRPAARLLDVEVKSEHSLPSQNKSFKEWPGTHKNVAVWWELENGKAVGWNEGRHGWAFPVIALNKKTLPKLRLWRVPEEHGHVYVCAANGRKAVNLMRRAGYVVTLRKFGKYCTDNWGDAMKGIAPKPGVWIVRNEGGKPERL
jgi:hypothetical protein